jgi:hypothetical protein
VVAIRENAEMSTTEKAFANLANIGPSEAEKAKDREVQRAIARTMAEVVADRHDPIHALGKSEKVTPVGVVLTTTPGWSEPTPLTTPEARATDEHVRRLADHFAPHAPESPLRPEEPEGAGVEALKATVARAQAILDRLEEAPKVATGGVPLLPGVPEGK